MNWKLMMTAAAVVAMTAMVGTATMAASAPATSKLLTSIDPDKDGTADMNEVRAAAGALFDRLDRDHDGTLDAKELRGRVSAKDLKAADPDNDGTLTKDEYLALVEGRFKAADPDKTVNEILDQLEAANATKANADNAKAKMNKFFADDAADDKTLSPFFCSPINK